MSVTASTADILHEKKVPTDRQTLAPCPCLSRPCLSTACLWGQTRFGTSGGPRQTDRQPARHTNTHIHRHTESEAETEKETETDRHGPCLCCLVHACLLFPCLFVLMCLAWCIYICLSASLSLSVPVCHSFLSIRFVRSVRSVWPIR